MLAVHSRKWFGSSEVSVNPFSCLVKNVEASRSSLCKTNVHWRPIKIFVFTYLFFPEK